MADTNIGKAAPQVEERFADVPAEHLPHYRVFLAKDQQWRDERTKALVRKLDYRLLPLLFTMWVLNFLDRSNLAQARLGTLEKDLGMKGTDFNLATSILSVGYITFQIPSNLLITRARPSIFLGTVMCIWGIVSGAQAATQKFGHLLTTRTILGAVEAPFFPGCILLMSSWYTRSELTIRVAWFFSGTPLANAIGGLIAAGVLNNLDGKNGIAGWRWLFLIEGTITVAVALCAIFVLPNFPQNTKWLTEEERSFARFRLAEDAHEEDKAGATTLLGGLKLALKDPRVYMFVLLQHLIILAESFGAFFPSIVKTLGYGRVHTLLLTVPVWAATLVVMILVSWLVGRVGDRSTYIMCLISVGFVGNVITTASTRIAPRYFGMFLTAIGAFGVYPIILCWIASSFARPTEKRGAVIALCNSMGNVASIYGPYMFPISQAPRYRDGGIASAVFCALVALTALGIRLTLSRENAKLARMDADRGREDSFRYPI